MQTLTQLPQFEALGKILKENSNKREIDFEGLHIDNRIFGDPKFTVKTKFYVIAKILNQKDTAKDKYSRALRILDNTLSILITHLSIIDRWQSVSLQKEFIFNLYEADSDKEKVNEKIKKTDVDVDNEIRIKLGEDADKFDIAQEVDHSLTLEEQISEIKPKLDLIAGKGLEEQAEEVRGLNQKYKPKKEDFVICKLNKDIELFCEDFPFINKRFYSALEDLRDDDYSDEEITAMKNEFETHKKTRNAFESLLNIGFDLDDLIDITICVLEAE